MNLNSNISPGALPSTSCPEPEPEPCRVPNLLKSTNVIQTNNPQQQINGLQNVNNFDWRQHRISSQQMQRPICAKRRRNGWQLPWDPMQLLSWISIFLLGFLSILVSISLPIFPIDTIFPVAVTHCSYFWCLLWMIILTTLDPSPSQDRFIQPVPFNRRVNEHVIENDFCNICRIKAHYGTKHCRQCNKCVPLYDHHCKWLNNCIGRKNYRFFIVLIVSLALISLVLFLQFTVAIVNFGIRSMKPESVQSVLFVHSSEWIHLNSVIWSLLCSTLAIFYLIIFAFTLHLVNFHAMLWRNGLTTLAYILQKREKEKNGINHRTISSSEEKQQQQNANQNQNVRNRQDQFEERPSQPPQLPHNQQPNFIRNAQLPNRRVPSTLSMTDQRRIVPAVANENESKFSASGVKSYRTNKENGEHNRHNANMAV